MYYHLGPITNVAIYLNSGGQSLNDQNNLQLVLEGIAIGAQATSVTWRRNGSPVDRNTILPNGGSFFDGGGEIIEGNGPCECQVYRNALQINGYLPGNYTFTATNSETQTPVTSTVFQINGTY